MVKAILIDLAPKRGAEAILFVNGFGATPLIELYLLYHEAARILGAAGVKPARSLVGSYVTSLDMAGASITVSMLRGGHDEILGCAGPHSCAALGLPRRESDPRQCAGEGAQGGSKLRSEHTLSLREQLLLVGVAAPLAVFILVLAPYYFAHYYVYKDAYLLAPHRRSGAARSRRALDRCRLGAGQAV